jgi:hypothetical protein
MNFNLSLVPVNHNLTKLYSFDLHDCTAKLPDFGLYLQARFACNYILINKIVVSGLPYSKKKKVLNPNIYINFVAFLFDQEIMFL